jgi:hypothetical protein
VKRGRIGSRGDGKIGKQFKFTAGCQRLRKRIFLESDDSREKPLNSGLEFVSFPTFTGAELIGKQ